MDRVHSHDIQPPQPKPYLGQLRWVTTHNSMRLQQYNGTEWVDVETVVEDAD